MASKSSGVQRKLTAILCADVAGYSRLMGADEEATVATLTAYRAVFISHIASHSGRVVDAKGDAILAEFGQNSFNEGSVKEARAQAADLRSGFPNLQPKAVIRRTERFRDPAVIERILADLAKAGMK